MATKHRLVIFAAFTLSTLGLLFLFSYQHPNEIQIPLLDHSISPTNTPTQSPTTPKILIVTAFFPLSKSKHTIQDYKSWLTNFLTRIETPIYFFAPPSFASLIRESRPPHLPITINTTFSEAFDVPPLMDLREEYEHMHKKDREAFRHSPELYSVWNAKPYFLQEGSNNANANLPSHQNYDYAFWVDAGSFRFSHTFKSWPDPHRINSVFSKGSKLTGTPQNELIFFPICEVPERGWRWWREKDGPVDFDFSEGSFFGGAPPAISWYRQTFYTQHDAYLSQGLFVGKDQTVINAIMFLYAKRFITVWANQPMVYLPLSSSSTSSSPSPSSSSINPPLQHIFLPPQSLPPIYCGSEWYFYEFFLASSSERKGMLRLWSKEILKGRGCWFRRGWRFPWRVGGGVGVGEAEGREMEPSPCERRDVLSVEDVLKARFGVNWEPR